MFFWGDKKEILQGSGPLGQAPFHPLHPELTPISPFFGREQTSSSKGFRKSEAVQKKRLIL